MFSKYEVAKADKFKKTRLADLCYKLAEAFVKQNAYSLEKSSESIDCSLFDCQNPESVEKVIFLYSEKLQLAKVEILYDCNGQGCYLTSDEKTELKSGFLCFPLWMLKQAAKEGIQFVSWRQIYLE